LRLRKAAVKACRLKSLAIFAIEAAPQGCNLIRADETAAAIIKALPEIGVEVAMTGLLDDERITPLVVALQDSFFETAQVSLDAGADVNGRSRDGAAWPLCAAAAMTSDVGMAWLLTHGASLTLVSAPSLTCSRRPRVQVAPTPQLWRLSSARAGCVGASLRSQAY